MKKYLLGGVALIYILINALASGFANPVTLSEILSSDDWIVLSPIKLDDGSRSVYAVEGAQVRSLPLVEMRGSFGPLLMEDIERIVTTAYRNETRPSLDRIYIKEILLKRVQSDDLTLNDRWFYVIRFSLIYDGGAISSSDGFVYMLSDGTIVQPHVEDVGGEVKTEGGREWR